MLAAGAGAGVIVVVAGGGDGRDRVAALARRARLDDAAGRRDDWERVPARVRAFLDEDARDGGPLLTTFLGYVASDLNVKLAGKRLHLHTNTARYRLGRIAERTGLDMRSFDDVTTLYVAEAVRGARHITPDLVCAPRTTRFVRRRR